MARTARSLCLLVLLYLLVVPVSGAAPSARADGEGALFRFDHETLARIGSLSGDAAEGEFGTRVADRFIATAPGAEGGGAILFWTEEAGLVSSVSAADLTERATARLGEDWGDLGHPPGTSNALVVGAPGDVRFDGPGTPVRPAVLVVEYGSNRITGEVRRVTGKSGSAFGWRVGTLDSQFPEASYNASWVASAPLEGKGKRRREAGAVYKYDTDTGRRLWRFRGERAGELAGYDLLVVPDLDDDGVAEVMAGAPGTLDRDPAGRVYILSGATGEVLERIEAPEEAVLFGAALARGSSISVVEGVLVGAPATPRRRKEAAGAVYVYEELDEEPSVLRGKRPDQWFGASLALGPERLYVGSFEGSRNANRHRRGSVTALSAIGRIIKTMRGRRGGDYFGREISIGSALAIGAPGAPPLFLPQ